VAKLLPNHELCGLVPHARQHRAVVVSQRRLADRTYAVQLHCPEIARTIVPGQFFMVRPAEGTDPLLGRPFALYDTILDEHGTPVAFEFAYHVIGKLTTLMSRWSESRPVEVWGPLGNGFPVFSGKHLLCVGGGIGYTPFLAVARETLGLRRYCSDVDRRCRSEPTPTASTTGSGTRVSFAYGVQSRNLRADLSDFDPLTKLRIYIATDDGTEGRKGFVTEIVTNLLNSEGENRPDGVYCCGPEPMMHATARLCQQANVACWLSLETPMACGFGACFSCVTKVRDDNAEQGWDYRRTCVEGPVFRAEELALPMRS
jgi:dihydroorotate dehydrogenase electron transfer subunit